MKTMELNSSPSSISPSFNRHSNAPLSHIAQRVIQEFEEQTDDDDYEEEEEFDFMAKQEYYADKQRDRVDEADDDDGQLEKEFEFHFHVEAQNPLKTADEIFQNGLIRPVYSFSDPVSDSPGHPNIRVSLRKLFMDERDQTATSSTSDDDDEELDGVPPESYCVWRPGTANSAAAGVCKKSGSTGSVSKKWKLRDIWMNNRSRSDGGKGSLVFPSEGSEKTATYGGLKKRTTTSYGHDPAGVSVMPTV